MLSVKVKICSSELSAKFCRHFWKKKKKIGCNILRTADFIKWALQLRGEGGGGGGGEFVGHKVENWNFLTRIYNQT